MRARPLPLGAAIIGIWLLATAQAHAKTYSADRFDTVVSVAADGTLDVTETVVFRFERGTFREVFREIPVRRTDGIDVLGAEMDGQLLPPGREIGTVEVRHRNSRVRVVWRFAPLEDATRTFVLRYRVRGAVRQDAAADRLVWLSTPTEHQYTIRQNTARFDLPRPPSAPPQARARRGSAPTVTTAGTSVLVGASDLRRNEWIETTLDFPPGSVAAAPPAWQQRAARIHEQSGRWIAGAAALGGLGLVLLVFWRQTYDTPPGELTPSGGRSHQAYPPDTLDPALAGLIVSNGQAALHHAVATLFSLAERGELEIREGRRSWGVREFSLTRLRAANALRAHERAALALVFKGEVTPGSTVTLSQARSRLAMRFGRFRAAMKEDLGTERLLDTDRQALRARYNRLGVGLLVLASAAAGLMGVLLTTDHGAWPLLIPGTAALVALAALIFGATVTPLSNEGVRRAAAWRAYRAYLRDVAAGREPLPGISPQAVLPYAIALGLAPAWAKYLQQHGHPVPPWFHAARPEDAYGAFPAFVAAGGAGSSSGGGGGGAAAGGGGSGAG